jgi:hypothetical protein
VSSYSLSLITEREILIDWQTTTVFVATFGSLFQSESLRALSDVLKNGTMREDEYHFFNLVYCRQCSLRRRHEGCSDIGSKDLIETYIKKFVIVRSNVYVPPALFANRIHRAALRSISNGTVLFHTLFKQLLSLGPEIQKYLTEKISVFELHFLALKYNRSMIFIASDSEIIKNQAQLVFPGKLYRIKEQTRQFSEEGINEGSTFGSFNAFSM